MQRVIFIILFVVFSILGIGAQVMAGFINVIFPLGAPFYYVNVITKTSWIIYIFLFICW